jgi:hypothetical protein
LTKEIKFAEEYDEVGLEYLDSHMIDHDGIYIDKYLNEDRTIDLEKLSLGIAILISAHEFSEKSKRPIKLFIKNIKQYFEARKVPVDNLQRITEESHFILGFCQASADEDRTNREVIVMFEKEN